MKKTGIFSNSMIWAGAAVSIAEIMTGALLAPLGLMPAIAAIVIGHIIGGILMYLAGMIGAKTEKSAMDTTKMTFGQKGSLIFSSLNILQLVGWTSVMVTGGAAAAQSLLPFLGGRGWILIIGALIAVWILIGIKNLKWLNIIAVGSLLVLSVVMSVVVFSGGSSFKADGSLSFGAAVELSAAMPISWLPLISDYTRNASKKRPVTLASVLFYLVISCWMFIIGTGAAGLTGSGDIAAIMLAAGFGVSGLIVVILSTVTTTFLDAFSAGVSTVSIFPRVSEKYSALVACVLGVVISLLSPGQGLENFLYLIGSVFVPMIVVQIVDFFIFKSDSSKKGFEPVNLALWLVGLIIYRIFMRIDIPVGVTLPVSLILVVMTLIVKKLFGGKNHAC